MPRARYRHLPADRRDAIVCAAGEEFARNGFERASVGRILAAAGASKGGLYYWFEDKADLFVTVVLARLAPLAATIGKPGPVGSSAHYWPAIRAMFDRGQVWLEAHVLERGLLRAAMRARASGALGDRAATLYGPLFDVATEVVLLGQAVGAIRDDLPIDLLLAVLAGVCESVDLHFSGGGDELQPEEVAAGLEVLGGMLRRVTDPG